MTLTSVGENSFLRFFAELPMSFMLVCRAWKNPKQKNFFLNINFSSFSALNFFCEKKTRKLLMKNTFFKGLDK